MKDFFTDDITPVKVERELREIDVQEAVVRYARARGCWARKFASPSNRSVPDYLFSYGKEWLEEVPAKWAIEFKAPGKKPTELQEKEHQAMRRTGWAVWVIDNIAEGKRIIDHHVGPK
jgi:hypothetical protein